jgi:membrane protein implicated in regulation of membrane protease activity
VAIDLEVGIVLVGVGIALLASELVHPGALLFIPGSILLVAGFLYLFFPTYLLDSVVGPVAILVAAFVATVVEIYYYRWVAPTHWPLSTTTAGLVGHEGIVTVAVVPDTIRGKVRISSEIWSARAATPIPVGTKVRVVGGEGVAVRVEPVEASGTP